VIHALGHTRRSWNPRVQHRDEIHANKAKRRKIVGRIDQSAVFAAAIHVGERGENGQVVSALQQRTGNRAHEVPMAFPAKHLNG